MGISTWGTSILRECLLEPRSGFFVVAGVIVKPRLDQFFEAAVLGGNQGWTRRCVSARRRSVALRGRGWVLSFSGRMILCHRIPPNVAGSRTSRSRAIFRMLFA